MPNILTGLLKGYVDQTNANTYDKRMSDYNQKLEDKKLSNWRVQANEQATIDRATAKENAVVQGDLTLNLEQRRQNAEKLRTAQYLQESGITEPSKIKLLSGMKVEEIVPFLADHPYFEDGAFATEGLYKQRQFSKAADTIAANLGATGTPFHDALKGLAMSGKDPNSYPALGYTPKEGIDPNTGKKTIFVDWKPVPNVSINHTYNETQVNKLTSPESTALTLAGDALISSGKSALVGMRLVPTQIGTDANGQPIMHDAMQASTGTPLGDAQNAWLARFYTNQRRIYLEDKGLSPQEAALKAYKETENESGPLSKPYSLQSASPAVVTPDPPGTIKGRLGVYTPEKVKELSDGAQSQLINTPDEFATIWKSQMDEGHKRVLELRDAGLNDLADKLEARLYTLLTPKQKQVVDTNTTAKEVLGKVGEGIATTAGAAINYVGDGMGEWNINAGKDLIESIGKILGVGKH